MNYGQIIYDLVNAATAYPVGALQMAQTQPAPFVVYAVNFIQPLGTKRKTEALDAVSFSVIVYDVDFVNAQAEANKIRTALTYPTAANVQSMWIDGSEHMYLSDAQFYAVVQNFTMRCIYTAYVALPSGGGIGNLIIGSTFIIA